MEAAGPLREVYLRPGDFCFGEGRLRINTLLGSCVAIVLWHPRLAHGGMCHYMLPRRNQPRGNVALDGRYGDEAMALFMLEIKKRHAVPAQYRVNIYGGGSMFDNRATRHTDVGMQNIEMARNLLDEHGFTLAYDTLGFGYSKIAFDVWSGEVSLMHVDRINTGK